MILYRGHQAVKGKKFQSWRSIGHVQQQVQVYAQRGCDELILLDIAATPEGRGPDFDLVAELTADLFCPVTVGGGVRSVEDVRELLRCGADKVSIRSNWEAIEECSRHFGSQALVGAVDMVSHGGVRWATGTHHLNGDVVNHAKWVAKIGAGELLLTSVHADGCMQGYDLALIRAVSAAVDIPVISNGGCSGYANMLEAIEAGASAVAAGALFAWTDATPAGAAKYLVEHDVEARA